VRNTGKPSTRKIEFMGTKIMAWTARTLGGARAAECLRWEWSMITDRDTFASCKLPRAKGDEGDAQDFEIPDVLRPFLRAWWEAHGRPNRGRVFPVTRGKRKGEARKQSGMAGRHDDESPDRLSHDAP
jgi:hypothetical protein